MLFEKVLDLWLESSKILYSKIDFYFRFSILNPSKALKSLVFAIIQFYAPSWFCIKSHPLSKDGPRNLLKMIGFSRKLQKKEQAVAQKAIQRNGFYAHIKLILKAMLIDENVSFRTRAANKIIEICKDLHDAKEAQVEADEEEGEQKEEEEEEEEEEEDDDEDEEVEGIGEFKSTLPLEFEEEQAMIHASVRKYVVPKINMNATSYPDLIYWEQSFSSLL